MDHRRFELEPALFTVENAYRFVNATYPRVFLLSYISLARDISLKHFSNFLAFFLAEIRKSNFSRKVGMKIIENKCA